MKNVLLLTTFVLFITNCPAQINITYTINANTGHVPISPYIYGSCNGGYPNASFMRQGGNRITGYNWENNASNAGQDYIHQSDDYLTWLLGLSSPQSEIPAIVTTAFVDSCNAVNAFSAVTLQMAGYVAKDKTGPVSLAETAPSARWCSVANTKPTAFVMSPDVLDNVVYMDEYMNFLINTYGNATTTTGVKAFILDNETALWPSTHPRIHPTQPTVSEVISKGTSLAKRVKEMDANVKVFGPESYGFAEYYDYQSAADWGTFSGTYPYFLSVYLDSMKQASIAAGHRLLDVFSVHWYPDVYAGNVYSSDSSSTIVKTRVQLPRTLWDNTYVESSWIGQWFSASLPILPTLKNQIATYYPGTELGITEYDYGGDEHISGGIAEADALGAFARTGTSYASKWGPFAGFSLSAIQLYNDVPQPFAGYYTNCSSSNIKQSTVHCAVEDTINKTLHIIAINKNIDSTITSLFNITSNINYDSVSVYWFDKFTSNIQSAILPAGTITGNIFNYQMERGGVYHFVLKSSIVSNVQPISIDNKINIYPNPVEQILNVRLSDEYLDQNVTWNIIDINGKQIMNGSISSLTSFINVGALAKGTYSICIQTKTGTVVNKFLK